MPDRSAERAATLRALDDVNDATWLCLLRAMQGVNLVLAETVIDDPSPNMRLDALIDAELARLTQT